MARCRRTHRKRKSNRRKTRKFIRSSVPPTRAKIMRGGSDLFPASFSNADVVASPQSYIPYNNYEHDPGYSVINSRNTGPFLTGTLGGSRRRRKIRGGTGVGQAISGSLNTATNMVGIMPSPALNETSGVSGIMAGFSNTGSAYSSTPVRLVPPP